MKILVLNSGSSSLKCSLFSKKNLEKIFDITINDIASKASEITIEYGDVEIKIEQKIDSTEKAIEKIIAVMLEEKIINSIDKISAVGYRVVHGGIYFSDTIEINDDVKEKIEICSEIAPLHNPANLKCIEVGEKVFKEARHFAVFDTAFHQTMPEKNYLYAIPKEYSEKYKIRKYGFHGISHQYVSEKLTEVTGKNHSRVISCHIGNGASVTAIKDGKCLNTSMGFTPVDGLVMGTRVGNIDPSAILFLQEKEGLSPSEIDTILNKKSGVLGLTGEVGDMRDLEYGIELGTPGYALALDIYITRIVRYIGSYIADLEGLDAIILTAGVMEGSSNIRRMIAERLEFAGVEFDDFQNLFRGEIRTISKNYSKTRLIVIPTDEEIMIAKEIIKLM